MAISYTHNEADAADIVQEGAYRAIRNCKDLKNTEFASTWVYMCIICTILLLINTDHPNTQTCPPIFNFQMYFTDHGISICFVFILNFYVKTIVYNV